MQFSRKAVLWNAGCFVYVKVAYQFQSPPFAKHIVWVHFSEMVIHSQDAHGSLYVNTTHRRLPFRVASTAAEVSSQWLACDSETNVMETKHTCSFNINRLDAVVNPTNISVYILGELCMRHLHCTSIPANLSTTVFWCYSWFTFPPRPSRLLLSRTSSITDWEGKSLRCTCCNVDLCCARRRHK